MTMTTTNDDDVVYKKNLRKTINLIEPYNAQCTAQTLPINTFIGFSI